jgi:hypothetical protein
MRWPLLVLVALAVPFLGSCGNGEPSPEARKERRERRQAAAEGALGKTPQPRTYRYQDGELRVMEVPSADKFGYVDHQRCYIWRDTEFKTSSISCPEAPLVDPLGTPVID